MKSCTFELIVNILTYAIKNKDDAFSQKDFKNVVYTKEFNNYDINEKISEGFEYLLKRGLLQLKKTNVTFYEKYELPRTIKINTENFTKVFKDLSKRIILMYEGRETISDDCEIKNDYADVIECVNIVNSDLLSKEDKEILKITLSKVLLSFNEDLNTQYSLLTIIQLLQLKSSIKISVKSNTYEFTANNVKFDYIQFNDDSILLSFDKCSFEINELENILNIECIDDLTLQDSINKSLEILKNYSEDEDIPKLVNYLESL